ncbi:NAD(P)/FAD-dependent oxidoreductase [Halorarum salinum]|uniref:NAD(P)/FAD-dependent oxidoreductase n=1 Tax=Halorarum salinum TaxID=2743089 RepID=A0A7D5QBA1_9EURY|nr:NAD(P)/FAD-dependent oxidoreductase [Halobaculum salinum]QLG62099.1 NAD(P)/FAD-dependent oxidoreductase [Halobaculum salinum]
MDRRGTRYDRSPFVDGGGHFSGVGTPTDCSGRSAAVVGGAVSGLAAAYALHTLGYEVTLYERQAYTAKRVNCGEAMTAASAVPLAKTPENGFANDTPAFEVAVYTDTGSDRRLVGQVTLPAADAYVTDRNLVERRWAEQLADDGVGVEADHSVTKAEFETLADAHDLLVDATGQPSLASKVTRSTAEYSGHLTALNADVTGDFSEQYPRSRMVLENYVGYAWAFPKSPTRANVGIGWAGPDRPDDYMAALRAACERNGWPVPTRDRTNVAIIPEGPSLAPTRTYLPEFGVVRVGDAAGIANRLTGKGISQGIHSSYLMAELAAEDRLADYPFVLHERLRPEYFLAHVVRGVLEVGEATLLGDVLEAVAGIDIEDVDRSPRLALARLARRPALLARLVTRPWILRRVFDAYTDRWEYRRAT